MLEHFRNTRKWVYMFKCNRNYHTKSKLLRNIILFFRINIALKELVKHLQKLLPNHCNGESITHSISESRKVKTSMLR